LRCCFINHIIKGYKRKRGNNLKDLHSAYYKSPIGVIRVEGNNEGVSFIDFLDEHSTNINNTNIDNKSLPMPIQEALIQLDEYFSGKRKDFQIKLSYLRGTEFQKKVWKALTTVPYGKTASYKDIAITIENPKAVRAVGGANNKNPHSIFVP